MRVLSLLRSLIHYAEELIADLLIEAGAEQTILRRLRLIR
jgi:hypothetical protein